MWNLAGRSMVYMIDGSYRFAAACARDHMFFLPRLAEVAGWLFDQGFAFYILRNGAIRVKIIHYRFVYRGDVEMKRWIIPPVDKQQAQQTAREFGMDAFGALLLLSRGITEETQIEEFLSEDIILQNPYALPDMEQAAQRVRQALQAGETIGIFGDYDADGITSTALLTDCLRRAGAHVVYRLPDREAGYGISREAADAFKAAGVSLIITVDNGITAVEEAARIFLCVQIFSQLFKVRVLLVYTFLFHLTPSSVRVYLHYRTYVLIVKHNILSGCPFNWTGKGVFAWVLVKLFFGPLPP